MPAMDAAVIEAVTATLLVALQEADTRRPTLERALRLDRPRSVARPRTEVRRRLVGYLDEWGAMLRANVAEAQQAIRRLVVDKLTLTPTAAGGSAFLGTGLMDPVIAGAVGPYLAWRPQRDSMICGSPNSEGACID